MNTKKWKSIGTVLGETNISEFYFSLKNYKAKKGDIITTESKIPSSEGNVVPVTVWGKISSIESSNVFFPTEAAQELTNENIDIRDTILPNTKDELRCKVIILGYTEDGKEVFDKEFKPLERYALSLIHISEPTRPLYI